FAPVWHAKTGLPILPELANVLFLTKTIVSPGGERQRGDRGRGRLADARLPTKQNLTLWRLMVPSRPLAAPAARSDAGDTPQSVGPLSRGRCGPFPRAGRRPGTPGARRPAGPSPP